MLTKKQTFDVVVCGGGLAGFCAAVSAARHGARTCLIQDRPVFGGNSSSEIRVTPHGAAAFHAYGRETGIISELLIAERAVNHEKIRENGWTNSVWDMVLYDMAVRTPNLTFYLNTTVTAVQLTDGRIQAVKAVIANAETELLLEGNIFIDCTGDGIVAELAGCDWRWGSEGRGEFNEPHAPLNASADTMGSSIHFRAKDMGRPVPFQAPDWAVRHDDPDYFAKQGRMFYDTEAGYWWIEIGVPWHTIHDNETIRHELTRHTLGIWDWMKNRDPELSRQTANLALDWIGQVPGKRESRRIMGHYLMTEHDVQNKTVFEDEIAFGGWFVDLHTPGGLLAPTAEPSSAEGYQLTSDYAQKSYCGPYGIPLRIMLAKQIGNLMMAGRNVSVTHAALGTVRVMGTTALLGQGAGTAAAYALSRKLTLAELLPSAVRPIQQLLLKDGCFLPSCLNEDEKDHARSAKVTASSTALIHGVGPDSKDFTFGFRSEAAQQYRYGLREPLYQPRGQWIAISSSRMDSISVCLSNDSSVDQTIWASIVPVDHIWDYRSNAGEIYARTELIVPAGTSKGWIDWPLRLVLPRSDGYIRLDLSQNEQVQWHSAGTTIPGHISAFDMGSGKMRRYHTDGGTQSYRISPPQSCFAAKQIISGVTRPHRSTNVWVSDPAEPLPQWVQLDWEKPLDIGELQLTFPGHLMREYHQYPPFYRDPQCPKDVRIEARQGESWRTIAGISGNFQQRVRLTLEEPVVTSAIRVVVLATNGSPSASVIEVRCYSP